MALATKKLLLILDNFEQVSDAAAEIAALLRGCKGLKILATSRIPLHLAGEHEYVVPPLSVPPPDVPLDDLLNYEAVQLFVARVRQQQHDFTILPMNAAAIRTICTHLDGLPLALELAAAALRHITLRQLVDILQDDANWLHALRSPARDLPPRQRTLYRAIAWSYGLLDATTQVIFRQLGVFVGGFTAEAAKAVCGAELVTLAHLAEQSLLGRGLGRWYMLEMILEFAVTQMNPEERAAVQQRHIAYYVATAQLVTPLSNEIENLVRDHANYRAALIWAIAAQDAQSALTLSIRLGLLWETQGYFQEGIPLLRAALAIPQAVDFRLRFDALERMSILNFQCHQLDVALQVIEQATDLARAHNESEYLARALNLVGRILIEQGDYLPATAALQECVEFSYEAPHRFNPGCPLVQLGEIALAFGEIATAKGRLNQGLALLTDSKESMFADRFIAMAHTHLAEIALAEANYPQTRDELRQVLPYARMQLRRLHFLLVTLAGLLLSDGHETSGPVAVAILGAEARLAERTGDSLSPIYQTLLAQRFVAAQQVVTQREWQVAWQTGYTWTLVQAVVEAEKWLVMD